MPGPSPSDAAPGPAGSASRPTDPANPHGVAADPSAQRAKRKQGVRVLLELVIGAVGFGVANYWTAPWVARVLGEATGHNETLLRLIGWCFGGLPFLVIGVVVFTRPLLLARGVVLDVLAVWIASNTTMIPARSTGSGDGVAVRIFRSHAADGLPIAFGLAIGLASFGVAFLGIGFLTTLLRGHGPFQTRSKPMLRAIQIWYLGWMAAGFVVVLTVAAPGSS